MSDIIPSTNALTKSDGSLDIRGMHDVSMSDLPIPRFRLVHPLSENTTLDTGTRAELGTFYNDASKKAYKELEFRVLHFRKGKIFDREDPTIEHPAYFLIGYHLETQKVFFFQIDKGNYWGFRNTVLPVLYNTAVDEKKPIYTPVVKVVSTNFTNKKGQKYLIMEFSVDVSKGVESPLSEILDNFTDMYEDFMARGKKATTEPLEGLEDVTFENLGN